MDNTQPSQDIIVPDEIFKIAKMVVEDWKNIPKSAMAYLDPMHIVTTIKDPYYQDNGEYLVRYFLSNATTWRGPVARAVKAKLNQLLKAK